MSCVVGIDACKGGWLTIRHSENGEIGFNVVSSLLEIDPLPDVIAIDIPIGLANTRSRKCDLLARKFIGARRSSVFPAPIRPILAETNYAAASQKSFSIQGKRISKQLFGILAQIREVDTLLRLQSGLRRIVYEVHPEVSFREWYGSEVPFAKKNELGRDLRMTLVAGCFGPDAFQRIRRSYLKKLVADDDILDAFAAVWTAWRIVSGTAAILPTPPQTDSVGQRMGIWY